MFIKKILSLALCTMSLCTFAATYYASPQGGEDGNSPTAPCTFAQGVSKIKNGGDTEVTLIREDGSEITIEYKEIAKAVRHIEF